MPSRRNQLALWWQFTRREIESRHRGTLLGVLWMILNPLLEFAIYATVFGVIFGGRYGVVEGESASAYALGVFLSLIIFRTVADTVALAPGVIVSQANLVKKVVFPLHLLPLSLLGGIVFRFLVNLTLFLAAAFAHGLPLTMEVLWMPLILLPLLLLCTGASWLLGALGVFLRDIGQVMGPASMVMLYASAIFYSAEKVADRSEVAWAILRWNPLLHLVENARRVTLWGMSPDLEALAYVWVLSLILLAIGWATFRRLRSAFADVL